MPTCNVCGQERGAGEPKVIYSARVLDEVRSESAAYGGRNTSTTTTYGEFMQHPCFVCSECVQKWDKLLVRLGTGATIAISVVLFILAIVLRSAWLYPTAMVLLIAGALFFGSRSTDERLKKQALRTRGTDGRYKSFTQDEFSALQSKS